MKLSFDEAKDKIQEADVLLFKNPGFLSIGWLISVYTRGVHSHAALASWVNGQLTCIEQREFMGGREVLLKTQIPKQGIDVYRICPEIVTPDGKRHIFTEEIATEITNSAREITGTSYGWKNIWGIFKGYAPGIRFLDTPKDINNDEITEAFVCSTVVAYNYRKKYIDICPNRPDDKTSPADLARSGLLMKMFTIVP